MLPTSNVRNISQFDESCDYTPLDIDCGSLFESDNFDFFDLLDDDTEISGVGSMDKRTISRIAASGGGDMLKHPASSGCTAMATDSRSALLSRQSSLSEEWFGNTNNTHPNDISIDSSLEALFAYDYNTDFGVTSADIDASVDLPLKEDNNMLLLDSDKLVKDSSSTDQSSSSLLKDSTYVSQSFCSQFIPTINTEDWLSASQSVAVEKSLPPPSVTATIDSKLEPLSLASSVLTSPALTSPRALPLQKPSASEVTPRSYTRKRHISVQSVESRDSDSDADSQSSGSDDSDDDLAKFAQEYLAEGCRNKPYFWQYNAQSRGPKGQRLCNSIELEDSHVVPDFMDPVFGSRWQLAPFQHSGKARHGDGNDPRPDPKKLLAIGCRIWKLETEFRAIGQESSTDGTNRSAANRQKNKLASRICRLKKKALHAANKIKLDGLKQEHGQLMQVIKSIVCEMEQRITGSDVSNQNLCQNLDQLIRQHLTFMIAGHTTDYVNSELEKVAAQLVSGKHLH